MSIEEFVKIISYCRCHNPVAVHKNHEIYIHGYQDGFAYVSQIYGKSKALFVRAEITSSKFIVARLKDNDGVLRTVAICKDDFLPVGAQARCSRIPVGEVVY